MPDQWIKKRRTSLSGIRVVSVSYEYSVLLLEAISKLIRYGVGVAKKRVHTRCEIGMGSAEVARNKGLDRTKAMRRPS
jgi:hypothetical protein